MTLWSPTRTALRRSRPDPNDPAYTEYSEYSMQPAHLASVLRSSPLLLLAGAGGSGNSAATTAADPDDDHDDSTAAAVDRLLREWNPLAVLPDVADGVRWYGPFRLDAAARAQAGLPAGWSTAYAAQAARSRTRVPDGVDAGLLRLRYPHGLPTGTEALAWSLIMGLARRLGGAGRLPAASPRGARSATVQRALAQENPYCVYASEALSWSALRSVLCLSLPELDHDGAPTADDYYCLDRPGAFEVRARPFRAGDFVPYALRPHTAAGRPGRPAQPGWPGTVYRFRCLPQQSEPAAQRIGVQLRAAACLLADVVGGVVLDGDGFPLVGAESAARR